jgi:hypothetical protein
VLLLTFVHGISAWLTLDSSVLQTEHYHLLFGWVFDLFDLGGPNVRQQQKPRFPGVPQEVLRIFLHSLHDDTLLLVLSVSVLHCNGKSLILADGPNNHAALSECSYSILS